jgi:2-dehydropantoate 2-reductase
MPAAIWRKLVVNASLNVVAALEGYRNGEVLDCPKALRRACLAAGEVADLARALGVPLGESEGAMEMERVARATAGNICSTLADLRAGRATEYESINGTLLRLARARGWSLPVLEDLDRQFALARRRHPIHLAAS